MSLHDTLQSKVRSNYKSIILAGLIVSLILVITSFKVSPYYKAKKVVTIPERTVIDTLIIPTRIDKNEPPRVKPITPVIAGIGQETEDIILDDVSLENFKPVSLPVTDNKTIIEDEIVDFFASENKPEPVGGFEGLMKRIKYPELEVKAGIEGKVIIELIVDEQGDVISAVVVKGLTSSCDKEALKAVKETKFIPGMQRGKKVKVKMVIPVIFRLKGM